MSEARERSWTVLELLRWTTDHFQKQGVEGARLDAECLLAHALGSDRLQLYLDFEKPIAAEERGTFRELVRRRAVERVPVAQLLGSREFWSLSFEVTPDVLVPRPETEVLVQAALDRVPDREAELRILDLGTGSGAIAVALARELPKAHVTATDVSAEALAVAARNAERHGVADRVRLVEGDAFAPVPDERFDLVVSNPPYVAESERAQLAPELGHEPALALFAGADGTAMLRRIVAEAGGFLTPRGWLGLEIGQGQEEIVTAWLREAGFVPVDVHRDLADHPRVVGGARSQGGA